MLELQFYMTDEQLIDIVAKEFRDQTLGNTQQYLAIHNPLYKDGKLVVSRIDRDSENEVFLIYLPVEEEKFYFTAIIEKDTYLFKGLSTEPWYRVYLTATSETKSFEELKALTNLIPTDGWSKGDFRSSGKSKHTFSRISFLPNPEPDTFENKLNHLLSFLETDKVGVKKLIDNASACIWVAANIHNGNGMIHGHFINSDSIKRMGNLNLSIDFDLYVSGRQFPD